ncbi:hypothetical protein FACS1894137_07590 [Spirochaetia bacterium]|nr:hypothetical protein FACS1894137_07590 [Spirochaetia bacterium]
MRIAYKTSYAKLGTNCIKINKKELTEKIKKYNINNIRKGLCEEQF